MAKTFASLIDDCENGLQDSANATWTAAELAIFLESALREISGYQPYLMREVFKIESRTGTADEDKANALVDDASLQFLATDVGKVVYNTDDKTWAEVTAFVDTGELTLSKDIFPDGNEDYKMFNEGCRSEKEIYIGDVKDYVGNNHGVIDDAYHPVEYPLGTKRNVSVSGDILTILMDTAMPDSDSTLTTLNKVEVFVWFRKRHRVSQLTDLAGAALGAEVVGATSMDVDGLSGVEIIAEDMLFTIAGMRGTYRVTTAVTLVGGATDTTNELEFWPALESAMADNAVVTFIGSTLDDRLERLVVDLTVALARMSKLGKYINEDYGGIRSGAHLNLARDQLALAYRDLEKGRKVAVKSTYSRL